MEFIIGSLAGISIGISLTILYGQYVSQVQAKQRRLDAEAMHRKSIELMESYRRFSSPSLEDQLKAALEREDYAEAERIRDLMNKR